MELWFLTKARGYGVVPVHWKGAATVAAYVFSIFLLVAIAILTDTSVIIMLCGAAASTVVLLTVVWRHGPKTWNASADRL